MNTLFRLSIVGIASALLILATLILASSDLCAAPKGKVVAMNKTPASAASPDITGVFVDTSRIHHDVASNGDTWDLAWADDDSLYTCADDSRGYAKSGYENFNVNELAGASWDTLVGISVNLMKDYGSSGQEFANHGMWKSTGCECIDGVLYVFVAKNWYGDRHAYGYGEVDPYLRQTALDLSIIKSTDHGKTWTRSEQDNDAHPMWTSAKFSTAYFFKYGRNGGDTKQDDQDKFVYAISNDGFWNDGTNLYLGRVPRAKIGDLSAADWRFYAGGDWVSDPDAATPVPGFPNGQVRCASGSPIWLAPIHKYVTVTWYNPEPADARLKWDYPLDRIFDFYQADHPWGPWSIIGTTRASDFMADPNQRNHRWYGPSFCAKYITGNSDKSASAMLTFAGMNWDDAPDSLYKFNGCPVTFYTTPQPRLLQWINDDHPAIVYSGGWTYETRRGNGDYRDDLHLSTTSGATIDFTFTGSGIEILSEKHVGMGELEVVVDGVSRGVVNQAQNPFPLLYRIPVYRNMTLANGKHTVRLIDRAPAGASVTFDGYKVYGSGPEPTNALVSAPSEQGAKYEAEAGVYGSAEAYPDGAASGGAAARKLDVAPGSGVKFTNVAAGSHLKIRYCTAYDGAKLSLYVNGAKVQDVALPKTGGWDGAYASVTVPVSIPAGAEIKLQFDPGDVAANVDYIVID